LRSVGGRDDLETGILQNRLNGISNEIVVVDDKDAQHRKA
jgi:hypothetical protein